MGKNEGTVKQQSLCATCEYLGNAVFPAVNRMDGCTFVGYSDRPNGEPVAIPARRCEHEKMQKTLVYEQLTYQFPCSYYKEREWTRPEKCGDCDLRVNFYEDGTFTCSGYAFTKHFCASDPPCVNGKSRYGKQISLF